MKNSSNKKIERPARLGLRPLCNTAPDSLGGDLKTFDDVQRWIRAEFQVLKLEPASAGRRARAAELKVRSHQLLIEVTRWMERHS